MSSYKSIGECISVIDDRNSDGSITRLLGLSIDKCYIPSVANIIGTDLKKYKVLRKGQFACSLMQVSRDQKVPIAMYADEVPAIISPAYIMFNVSVPNILLPEYLDLWFKRMEFDREATFYAIGGVRGSLDWEDFCNMKLPVPSISEQRKIVRIYRVITDRIELLQKINRNLEEQAQAIYKSWFVNFEPWGGVVPRDWQRGIVANLAQETICGKTPPTKVKEYYGNSFPFITIPDMHKTVYVTKTERYLSERGEAFQKGKTLPLNSVCVSCIGTAGLVVLTSEPSQTNQQINAIIPRKGVSPYYIFFLMKSLKDTIIGIGQCGTTMINLNKTQFEKIEVMIPQMDSMKAFEEIVAPLFKTILLNQWENQYLTSLRDTLLQRLMSGKLDLSKLNI